MKLEPIITSLLETDLYKFNMGNVIFKQFNNYSTTWTFKCRNKEVKFSQEMIVEIREQVDHYCSLRFSSQELSYLKRNCPWLSEGYLNHLKFWHPVREEIFIQGEGSQDGGIVLTPYTDCGLAIEARGTWLDTSMYEIALLAIVNEVYFSFMYDRGSLHKTFGENTERKVIGLQDGGYDVGAFSEFGMRRRLSAISQDWVVGYLRDEAPGFVGTSNVYLAKKYGVKPIGTMAHEFIQCVGQGTHEYNPAYSNLFSMKAWTDEYQTRNGIVLGDTITTDCFLKDFNLSYATLFSGVRHDSGDPILWGEKMISHYKRLGIDPTSKTLLFSDSLNFEKATKIKKYFEGKCRVAFGIGTYLANDAGVEPLNIVMKVTECNGSPVAKLSDVEGKGMCRDEEYVDYLRRSISWRMEHDKGVF